MPILPDEFEQMVYLMQFSGRESMTIAEVEEMLQHWKVVIINEMSHSGTCDCEEVEADEGE